MIHVYGLNGNDLDWDFMETLFSICWDCEYDRVAEKKLSKEEYYDDYFYMCENHTHIYTPIEIDFEYIHNRRLTVEDVASWGIIHDTNDNFVGTFGNVPDDAFIRRK